MWISIFFQMFVVFYIMILKKFTFDNMEFDRNFYIKFTNNLHAGNQFYIYDIDGIEYFCPDYGYLLLFDSDFHNNPNLKPAPPTPPVAGTPPPSKDEISPSNNGNKIIIEKYNGVENLEDVYKKIKENGMNIFNHSIVFSATKTATNNTVEPGNTAKSKMTEILQFFNNFNENLDKNAMKTYFENGFLEIFQDYLNNRIGSTISMDESKQIKQIIPSKGDLFNENNIIKIYIDDLDDISSNPNIIKNSFVNETLPKYSIYQYSNRTTKELFTNFYYIVETYKIQ